jgi:hypothetical protein
MNLSASRRRRRSAMHALAFGRQRVSKRRERGAQEASRSAAVRALCSSPPTLAAASATLSDRSATPTLAFLAKIRASRAEKAAAGAAAAGGDWRRRQSASATRDTELFVPFRSRRASEMDIAASWASDDSSSLCISVLPLVRRATRDTTAAQRRRSREATPVSSSCPSSMRTVNLILTLHISHRLIV